MFDKSCSCWIGRGSTFGLAIERELCAKHGILAERERTKNLAERLCRVMIDDEKFCWNDGGREQVETILAEALEGYRNA